MLGGGRGAEKRSFGALLNGCLVPWGSDLDEGEGWRRIDWKGKGRGGGFSFLSPCLFQYMRKTCPLQIFFMRGRGLYLESGAGDGQRRKRNVGFGFACVLRGGVRNLSPPTASPYIRDTTFNLSRFSPHAIASHSHVIHGNSGPRTNVSWDVRVGGWWVVGLIGMEGWKVNGKGGMVVGKRTWGFQLDFFQGMIDTRGSNFETGLRERYRSLCIPRMLGRWFEDCF